MTNHEKTNASSCKKFGVGGAAADWTGKAFGGTHKTVEQQKHTRLSTFFMEHYNQHRACGTKTLCILTEPSRESAAPHQLATFKGETDKAETPPANGGRLHTARRTKRTTARTQATRGKPNQRTAS